MSDTEKKTDNPAVPIMPSELSIHFIKSNLFRVVHANGAWFGNDPQANLHLTFYSERTPIPQKAVFQLNEKGQFIGEDVAKREAKEGVVREMEVDIVLSLTAAAAFYDILGANLKQATELLKQQAFESK